MKSLLLVMMGGAVGSALRFLLSCGLPFVVGGWPWATFLANILGGLAMGFFASWLFRAGATGETARLLLGVGVLGGFTTFSTFSMEIVQMFERGANAMAMAYAGASLILALFAVFVGMGLGRAIWA